MKKIGKIIFYKVLEQVLTFVALDLWVTSPAIRAAADGSMLAGGALRVETTRVGDHTWVLTALVHTCTVAGAL